jgi:hypothetical protein
MTITPKLSPWLAGAFWLAIAVGSVVCPLPLNGQVTTAPTIVLKQPKPKYDSFRGRVVNCTTKAITVRAPGNVYNTRTFDFSPGLLRKMENRSMNIGAKVTVKFQPASNVAVSLKGQIVKLAQ